MRLILDLLREGGYECGKKCLERKVESGPNAMYMSI
jgi:hypothetical protein